MGPRFKVSFERLEKPGMEPTTPGLQDSWLNHSPWRLNYYNYIVEVWTFVTSDCYHGSFWNKYSIIKSIEMATSLISEHASMILA